MQPDYSRSMAGICVCRFSRIFETEFGITDFLCRKVLDTALSKGGDFADLYFEHTISNYVGLEDGKVDRVFGQIDLGVGI